MTEKQRERVRKYGAGMDNIPDTEIPPDVPRLVDQAIEDFRARYGIKSMMDATQSQWRACCMYIGESVFRSSKIIHDIERERTHGGVVYDPGVVEAVMRLWAYLCGVYSKAPLIGDFAAFCGVSDNWLNISDTARVGVTPARMRIVQTLHRIQEQGVSALAIDSKRSPIGALAFLNHYYGWTTSRSEVVHSRMDARPASELPKLDAPSTPVALDLVQDQDGI